MMPHIKCALLLEKLLTNFKCNYNLGRELSIDEHMIGFKGRTSFIQYMPKKPTKWGLKAYVHWQIPQLGTHTVGYCIQVSEIHHIYITYIHVLFYLLQYTHVLFYLLYYRQGFITRYQL